MVIYHLPSIVDYTRFFLNFHLFMVIYHIPSIVDYTSFMRKVSVVVLCHSVAVLQCCSVLVLQCWCCNTVTTLRSLLPTRSFYYDIGLFNSVTLRKQEYLLRERLALQKEYCSKTTQRLIQKSLLVPHRMAGTPMGNKLR